VLHGYIFENCIADT